MCSVEIDAISLGNASFCVVWISGQLSTKPYLDCKTIAALHSADGNATLRHFRKNNAGIVRQNHLEKGRALHWRMPMKKGTRF